MINNLKNLERQLNNMYETFIDVKLPINTADKKEIEKLLKRDTASLKKQLNL